MELTHIRVWEKSVVVFFSMVYPNHRILALLTPSSSSSAPKALGKQSSGGRIGFGMKDPKVRKHTSSYLYGRNDSVKLTSPSS